MICMLVVSLLTHPFDPNDLYDLYVGRFAVYSSRKKTSTYEVFLSYWEDAIFPYGKVV